MQWDGVSMCQNIYIFETVKQSIWSWTRTYNLKCYRQIIPPQPEIITLDASLDGLGSPLPGLIGWGAFALQNNRGSFKHFGTEGLPSNLQIDNSVAVAYIQRQGRTRSRTLMREVRPIFEWAQLYLTDLRAVYVPAAQNRLVDDLSRTIISNKEWCLSSQAFSLLMQT